MRKIIYLLIIVAVASCVKSSKTGNLVPDVPKEMPEIPLSVNVDVDSFPHRVDVKYIGDSVVISKLPVGVQAVITGADVAMRSSSSGVEYSLSGTSDNGSFTLVSTHSPLVTLSSLKLFSHKKNTIYLSSSKGVFMRSADKSLNFLIDGLPKDTASVPKKSATLFIEGDAVISSGSLALRGERKNAIHCTGKLILNNANIAVEAARVDALSADSGLLVLSGNLNIKTTKNALKSECGDVSVCNGVLELECSGYEGNAVEARNIYVYGGNVIARVNGLAAIGLNSEVSTYLLGGLVDVTSCMDTLLPKNNYTSGACIKTENNLFINDALVMLKNEKNAGTGISCNGFMQVDGGTLIVENRGNDLHNQKDVEADVSVKGIKCTRSILIRGGFIEVLVYGKGELCEGIETEHDITIEGKNTTVYVYAYDDALYCGRNFVMNGGRFYAYSVANDAVETNNEFLLNGGILIANGCGESGQGIYVDRDSCFTIKGGTLVTISGTMGLSPSVPISVNTQQATVAWSGIELMHDKYISVVDENDNQLFAYRIPRTLCRATFTYSSDKVKTDKTYSLIISDSLVANGGQAEESVFFNKNSKNF